MTLLAASSPHVSLVADTVLELGPIRITNSTLLGLIGTGILTLVLVHARNRAVSGRHTRLSIGILWLYEILLGTVVEVLGSRERALRLAPLAITLFLVIVANNWSGLLPFVGPVTYQGLPLFRGLAADLNFTLALAIITMVTAQVWAIRTHGFGGNLGRYFANPFKSPSHAFAGLLELVAEFSRLVALAMRLFGNVFGGEVLLVVIAFITAWLAPISLPVFMVLELFVGAVQAYVFFMLTVVFVSLGASTHESDEPARQVVKSGSAASAH